MLNLATLDLGLGVPEQSGSFAKQMKLYELLDPLAIRLLDMQRIMFEPHDAADVVQQGWRI
nr:hypothetical protein [Methylomonas koyamae]